MALRTVDYALRGKRRSRTSRSEVLRMAARCKEGEKAFSLIRPGCMPTARDSALSHSTGALISGPSSVVAAMASAGQALRPALKRPLTTRGLLKRGQFVRCTRIPPYRISMAPQTSGISHTKDSRRHWRAHTHTHTRSHTHTRALHLGA